MNNYELTRIANNTARITDQIHVSSLYLATVMLVCALLVTVAMFVIAYQRPK